MTKLEEMGAAMHAEFERQVRRDNPGLERVPARTFDELDPHVRAYWIEAARLGVNALREPSASMVGEAGAGVLNRYVGADPSDTYYGTADWADECWQAMCDAILNEQPSDPLSLSGGR